jgi:hypothetical protein
MNFRKVLDLLKKINLDKYPTSSNYKISEIDLLVRLGLIIVVKSYGKKDDNPIVITRLGEDILRDENLLRYLLS